MCSLLPMFWPTYCQSLLSSAVSVQIISRIPKSNILIIDVFCRGIVSGSGFLVWGFRYLGILRFRTVSKPKINLKHTFSVNFYLKPNIKNTEMFESRNWKLSYQNQKNRNRDNWGLNQNQGYTAHKKNRDSTSTQWM